jgi:hypothetical protein
VPPTSRWRGVLGSALDWGKPNTRTKTAQFRHLTLVIDVDAGRKVVDGWLAGSLAVLAVEGVIADAFVARSCS